MGLLDRLRDFDMMLSSLELCTGEASHIGELRSARGRKLATRPVREGLGLVHKALHNYISIV